MKYSIILPVRNGGEYVKECIRSILLQSIADFNLLILDNCSTDGTTEWLHSLKDERIKIYPSDKPLSIEQNWGRITTIEKNEFITLIGHDDILDPTYLETMDQLIDLHPHAGLYQTHFRYINAGGGTIRACKPMAAKQTAPEFLSFVLCHMIDTMGTGFMMRSEDYDRLGGIPPYPNLLFADFELWIKLIGKKYLACSFNECFAFRLHQSTTTTSSDLKFGDAFKKFTDFLIELKAEDEINKAINRYGIEFMRFYTKGLAHRLLRSPYSKRNNKSVKTLLAECKAIADELVPGNSFQPEEEFSVRLARQIDSNTVTRHLFLQFKKLYAKPVYQ